MPCEIIESETRTTPCPCCGDPVTSIDGVVLLDEPSFEAEFLVRASGDVLHVAIVVTQNARKKGSAFLWEVTREKPRPLYADPNAWPTLREYARVLPLKTAHGHPLMARVHEALRFLLQGHEEVARVYRFVVERGGDQAH